MTLRNDKVLLANGHIINDYFEIENANWINVIVITEDGKFVFESQYRHGIDHVGYELLQISWKMLKIHLKLLSVNY